MRFHCQGRPFCRCMDVGRTIKRSSQTAVRARSLSYTKDRKNSEAARSICGMKCDKTRIRQTFLPTLTRSRMYGWTRLLVILAAAAVQASSDQQLFQQHATPGLKPVQRASDKANSTGNLIFWSVSSLLQHWPNTRYINGTVVL